MTPSEFDSLIEALRRNAANNSRERRSKVTYGVLVCVCEFPVADLKVNAGQCAHCFRKPLALMAVRSAQRAA